MALEIECARLLLYKACWLRDNKEPFSKEAAMAKVYSSRKGMELSRLMVRLYGGNGTNREFKPGLYYRRTRIADYDYGDADFQREIVAKGIGLVS